MKKMKKILSVALVLVLALAFAVPAFAAQPAPEPTPQMGGTITIHNAVEGKTYSAYRLLDLSLSPDSVHYSYTVAAGWEQFFAEGGADYVSVDENTGTVTWNKDKNTDADKQEFAKRAQEYAKSQNIDPAATANVSTGSSECKMTGLQLGYYLVTAGTDVLLSLDTTDTDAVMYDKNDKPAIPEKDADKVTAAVDEIVHFTVPVTKEGVAWDKYTVKDTMTGLQYVDGISVKIYDKTAVSAAKGNYQALSKEQPKTVLTITDNLAVEDADKAGFQVGTYANNQQEMTVVLPKAALNSMIPGDVVLIEYNAKVMNVKVVNNDVVLQYTNGPSGDAAESAHQKKYIYNYEIEIDKIDENQRPLSGAKFELYEQDKDQSGRAPIQFVKTEGAGVQKYTKATTEQIAEGKNIVTVLEGNADGKLQIWGLDAKTYYLREVEAPAGYNRLVKDAVITIKAEKATGDSEMRPDYTVMVTFDKNSAPDINSAMGTPVVKIINKTGTELPSTGGMGTTIFYVVGGLMMASAVVALIVKKRMKQ